jgi:hypothetical protein
MKNNNKILLVLLGLTLGLGLSMLSYDVKVLILLNVLVILISLSLLQIFTFHEKLLTTLNILETNHDLNMRCLKFTMINNNFLEGEVLFKGIYNTLMNNQDFITFGYHKIIILSVTISNNREYNIHSNTLIANDTTFEDYYLFVSNELSNYNNLQYGYHNEEILKYNVLCWNVDDVKNSKIKQTHNTLLAKGVNPRIKNIKKMGNQTIRTFSTSSLNLRAWYKGLIKPISLFNKKGILKQKNVKAFFTMDIETINFNNIQIPIAISSCGFHNDKVDTQLFLIDHTLLKCNQDLALQQL